jgi:hypothetical protein
METQNLENKNLEALGNSQASSASIEKQTQNLALPEMGSNAITTEADSKNQDEQKLLYKYENQELTLADLDEALSKTIFEDTEAKRILFLSSTLTFTGDHQKNVILTGASSTGKTYNIKEILWFFQNEGQNKTIFSINDATPRSLIYSSNAITVDERNLDTIDFSKQPKKGDPKELWDEWHELKRHSAQFIDLSNKILVFYDIPNFALLQNLRSLLSHDEQICRFLVTVKGANGSHTTRTVLIKGYFTAIFASAYSTIDEQESSRTFMLSPTDSSEKIRKAIELQGLKLTDPNFNKWYESEPSRVGLKNRIEKIRNARISKVLFQKQDMENLTKWFLEKSANLSPRAQRDFPRLISLAQAWALLNFQSRTRTLEEYNIYAHSRDIEIAKTIYEPILQCNELGLSPEEYEVWAMIEKTFGENKNYIDTGLKVSEVHNIYYYEKKRRCVDKRLREMLKNFCSAGLLKEDKEGVLLKYYLIMHKDTKQSGLSLSTQPLEKVETNPFFQPQCTSANENKGA